MNRREAMALLTSVPGLTAIRKADLHPGDTLVLEYDGMLTDDEAARFTTLIEQAFPDHKALVLMNGMKLSVLRKTL